MQTKMENKTLNFINGVSPVLVTNLPILEFIAGFDTTRRKEIKESRYMGQYKTLIMHNFVSKSKSFYLTF